MESVVVMPKPNNGITSKVVDWLEKLIVKLMYDASIPHHWLAGNFAPVTDETPPLSDLTVIGHLPECLNGEFVRVGPNPKFSPVAGYHWFDGDGMIHGLRIKDGKATYVSRFVQTSRLKQEEYFGGAKFMKIGDMKGLFGLLMVNMQMLRAKLKVVDLTFGHGTANTALVYHHGKLLALSEGDKPYALRVFEDGDLQTLGLLDYDKRLSHNFTAHPKVDPFTGEMFTFGYSHTAPYITYRVISKDGFMHDPVPITIPEPIMMHDFAITENYAIFMDLPLYFRPKCVAELQSVSADFTRDKERVRALEAKVARLSLVVDEERSARERERTRYDSDRVAFEESAGRASAQRDIESAAHREAMDRLTADLDRERRFFSSEKDRLHREGVEAGKRAFADSAIPRIHAEYLRGYGEALAKTGVPDDDPVWMDLRFSYPAHVPSVTPGWVAAIRSAHVRGFSSSAPGQARP